MSDLMEELSWPIFRN